MPTTFLPRGREFDRKLKGARATGQVTQELVTAFRDPAVAFARPYEAVVVAVVGVC